MAVKTWDGTTNSFDSAADWSPAGVPQPGDIAIINAGTVTARSGLLQGLNIEVNGINGASGSIDLTDTTVAPDTQITVMGIGGVVAGQVNNQGIISAIGAVNLFSSTGPTGVAGMLDNTGTINVVDGPALLVGIGRTPFGSVQNNGVISVWNPSGAAQTANLASLAGGAGLVQLFAGAHVTAPLNSGGQTFRFIGGAGGASSLSFNEFGNAQDRIAGFAAPDTISLITQPFTSYAYASSGAASGVLTLSNGGAALASIAFDGAYQQSDFTLTTTTIGNVTNTTITTTVAPPAQDIELLDSVLDLSAFDASSAYSGPVIGLQHQYIWAGNDSVGIAALSNNVFLKGSAGNDALQAAGGSNVLDGGGGSNFLTGAAGADGGKDTFFVDGRTGTTWDSIVDFHPGDAMTLFGFQAGQSAFSWTASDGAAGFQGATIHAELNGAGTGANASVTFARIGIADAQSKFTISTGVTGGVGYLYVAYAA